MYSQTKKSNAFVGFLIALLMVIPAVLGVIFADNIKGWFGTPEDVPTEEVNPDGDVVTDIENSEMLSLTKRNKISANGQTLSVSATLSPEWVIDKTVSWSLAWKGSSSGMVSQYVSITPSADTLTCEVKVLKEFTTQIVLTCTATSNSDVKATCTIDYVSRKIYCTHGGEWGDLIGEVYSEYKVSDLYNPTNVKNVDNYTTSGGTLNGTLQNVQITSVKVDGKDVTSNQTQTLENILVSNHGDIYSAYEELEGRFDVEITITADVYYNNTLIQSGVTGGVTGYYFFDYSAYKVTNITLSDTQLIF